MPNNRFLAVASGLILVLSTVALRAQTASNEAPLLEQGKFTLHKFEQPIGEETYEIRRESDSLAVKVDFKFTDRGTAVPLSVTFQGGADLTPKEFDIKGRTARSVSIDESVNVENGKVQLRSRDTRTEEDATDRAILHDCRLCPRPPCRC